MKNEILEQLVLEAFSYDFLKEAKKKTEPAETKQEEKVDTISSFDIRVKNFYDFLVFKGLTPPDFLREHEIKVLKNMAFPMTYFDIESFFDGLYVRIVKKSDPSVIYSIIKDFNDIRRKGDKQVTFNPSTYAVEGTFQIIRDGFFFSKTDPSVDINKILEEDYETDFTYVNIYSFITNNHPAIAKEFKGDLKAKIGNISFKRLKRKKQTPAEFDGKALVVTGSNKKFLIVVNDFQKILTKPKKFIYEDPEEGDFIAIIPEGVFKYVNTDNKLITVKVDMSSHKTFDAISFDSQDVKGSEKEISQNITPQQNITTLSTEVMKVVEQKFKSAPSRVINSILHPQDQMKLASIQIDKTLFTNVDVFNIPNGGVSIVVKKPDTFNGSYVTFICTKDSEFKTSGNVNTKINTRRFYTGILVDETSSVSVKDFESNTIVMTIPYGANVAPERMDLSKYVEKEPQYQPDDKPEEIEPTETQKSSIIRDFEKQFFPDEK